MLLYLTTAWLSFNGALAAADDTEPDNRLLVSLITDSWLPLADEFELTESCPNRFRCIQTAKKFKFDRTNT